MSSSLRFWLRGSVTARVTGSNPAALYNACTAAGIPVYGMEQRQGVLHFTVPAKAYARLRPLASKAELHLRCVKKSGLPFLLLPYAKRWGFFAGIGLFFLLLFALGSLTWTVEVEGNHLCSAEKILAAAAESGIRPGAKLPAEELSFAEQKALLQLPELSWLAFNRAGSRMRICVTERSLPRLPADKSRPGHLLADTDGVLIFCDVFRGQPLLQPGQPFCKGDVLVSGYLYGQHSAQSVHADASLQASVGRTYAVFLPFSSKQEQKTGRKTGAFTATVFGRPLHLGPKRSPYARSAQRQLEKQLIVWKMRLPVSFSLTLWEEEVQVLQKRTADQLRAEGILRLEEKIRADLGEKGILQEISWASVSQKEGILLRAEARLLLPVGQFSPIDPVPPPLSEKESAQ